MRNNILKNKEWQEVILTAGRQGRHITYFLDILGISLTEHSSLLENNQKYAQIVSDYEKLCEEYWYNLAYTSMTENNGHNFNTRLWTVIMKNKFSDRWNDTNKVDLTSKGEKIESPKPIQIEVVRKALE